MSDLIGREYATRYFIGLRALDKITNDNYDGKITFDEVIARLGVIPSAEPERLTGKWIERNPQNSPNCRLIECSECGNAYIVGYNIDYDYWIDGRNFCTKCGADMRGEE